MKFEFTGEEGDEGNVSKFTLQCQHETRGEVLDSFKQFLLGCGYHLPAGPLEFTPTPGEEY